MPKSPRPDIQVLEDRIVRLKSQLIEYKDLRLYKVTKNRLSSIADELEECVSMIHEIVDDSSNNISSTSISAYEDFPVSGPSEFSSDGDLLDTFLLDPPSSESKSLNQSSPYTPKKIVKTYSERLNRCSETVGCSSGILQVNQFCQVLNSWYQARFTPSDKSRNPDFFFKATNIHEWVDLMMLSAGHALHEGLFPAFISDMNAWIADLNTPKDQSWALPYTVMRMKNVDASRCTQEAVLFERMIKPTLYDDSFYPKEKNSVAEIVINNSEFTKNNLTVEAIVRDCGSRLVITSSFDLTEYQEDENV